MAQRMHNNWATAPEVSTRAQVAKAKPQPDSEEDPDEVSVPEGPASGSLVYRRGASARSSRTSAGALSPTSGLSSGGAAAGSGILGGAGRQAPTEAPQAAYGGYAGGAGANVGRGVAGGAVGALRGAPSDDESHDEDVHSSPVTEGPYGGGVRTSRTGLSSAGRRGGLAPDPPAQPSPAPPPPPQQQQQQRGAFAAPQPPPAAAGGPRLQPQAPARRPAGGEKRGGGGGGGWGDMLVEDMDDLSLDPHDLPTANNLGTTLRGGAAGAAAQPKGTPLSPDQGRQLCTLLWGAHGQPPASWQQGFFFSTTRGLQYGLVQAEGGPCGVLASVQALVLANLRQPSGAFNLEPTAAEQHEALVSALADVVWAARIGPAAYVAVAWGEGGRPASSLAHDQMVRSVTLQDATSREQLKGIFKASLACYTDRGGWGILLLLYSVLLSHGLGNVRADMDEPSNALMGMHGYCTQELVNLLITGQAASNVFDGNKDLDGSTLHGITRRCRVGLLTLFEWYKYVEVGTCLKSPDLPIWVVCSESHFTVLFSNDARAQRGEMPFDLHYYDELANQQAPIRLTIKRCLRGGWTARVGDSFADRGKCEGQNIPPLECVIETRWPGVTVNWNGTDPIL